MRAERFATFWTTYIIVWIISGFYLTEWSTYIFYIGFAIPATIFIFYTSRNTYYKVIPRLKLLFFKDKFLNNLVKNIKKFEPVTKFEREELFQAGLYGWLKNYYKKVLWEKQKGSSRPDLVISNVAIEIKGPTSHRDLKTVADKIIRYKQHFSEIIIVLYKLKIKKRLYVEWKRGILKTHPDIIIIKR